MTKSSFWASSLMGKERPYRSLLLSIAGPRCIPLDSLVLQDDDRVGIADSGLEQTLCVLGAVWADNL
jgi:hypothetical protein